MNYPYTIEDLARIAEVSKQSIYNLLSKDKEFINSNSTKQKRKIKYNQAVLDMILAYYDKQPAAQEPSGQPQETPEQPSTVSQDKSEGSSDTSSVEALKAEIAALKQELEDTKAKLEKSEAERQEMIKQNGLALLLIQQEKQEKLLLLPGPKKPLPQRIKEFFVGEQPHK